MCTQLNLMNGELVSQEMRVEQVMS